MLRAVPLDMLAITRMTWPVCEQALTSFGRVSQNVSRIIVVLATISESYGRRVPCTECTLLRTAQKWPFNDRIVLFLGPVGTYNVRPGDSTPPYQASSELIATDTSIRV